MEPMAKDFAIFSSKLSFSGCSSGWLPNGDYCYKRFETRKSWNDADKSCQKNGGAVVSITSEEEHLFLKGSYFDPLNLATLVAN